MLTVDIVVLVARHVDNVTTVSSNGALSGISRGICKSDGAKVGKRRKAVAKGDGFDDPVGVDLAKSAGGLAGRELVNKRSVGSLVRESSDAACCRVCSDLHEDGVSCGNVPVLVEVLDALLRPPLVPGYTKFIYISCYCKLESLEGHLRRMLPSPKMRMPACMSVLPQLPPPAPSIPTHTATESLGSCPETLGITKLPWMLVTPCVFKRPPDQWVLVRVLAPAGDGRPRLLSRMGVFDRAGAAATPQTLAMAPSKVRATLDFIVKF